MIRTTTLTLVLAITPLCTAAELVRLDETNWAKYAPAGKEVDAIYGDYVLVNDDVVAVVANPIEGRNANLKYRDVGGTLIDLTTRQDGEDLLHALYPANHDVANRGRRYSFRKATIERASGQSVALVCEAVTGSDKLGLTVRYELTGGKPLRIETVWTNRTDKPIMLRPADEVHSSGLKTLATGPSGAAALENDAWWQGYALLPAHPALTAAVGGNAGDQRVRYRPAESADEDGPTVVPANGELTIARWVFVGRNGLDVQAAANLMRNVPMRRVALNVTDDAGAVEDATVRIERGGATYGTMRSGGAESVTLPEGAVVAKVYGVGRTTQDLPIAATGEPTVNAKLDRPGYVAASITGNDGKPTPCKVQFIGVDGTDSPFWFDKTGEHRVHNCYHSHDGEFTTDIGPGKYRVIISYGPEHDAVYRDIIVKRGETTELTAQLKRTVDTTGWISADFHAHSSPSGDNDASQFGRVLSILIEDLNYVPCTEHQRIDSYAPHLRRLNAEHLLGTSTGMELTGRPLPVNHQNAFPLVHKPHTQDGGGPRIDDDPVVQISRLALWDDGSEKLVQQNHPNLVEIAGHEGTPDGKLAAMLPHMDVIEVHPPAGILYPRATDAKTGHDTGRNRIATWVQLINRGVYAPGVVNTDAHYNFHGMGWLRNYIKSPTDNPAKIDTMDVVREAEAGHVVMSTGPFMEVRVTTSAQDSAFAIPGDTVAAPGGKAKVHVKVQCPNWFDVNRVFVLVNGQPVDAYNFTRKTHPKMFADGVVKFDQTIDVKVDADAHLIVVAVGEGLKLGEVMGPDRGKMEPIAVANPVFLDVDGNGFRPAGGGPVE